MITVPKLRSDRRQSTFSRRALGAAGALVLPVALLSFGAGPALAASVTHARTVAAASASCSPTSSTLDGGPAISYCGPATATLTIGGKTYSFKNGFCQSIKVSDIVVDITLGTIAEGKNGDGAPGNAGKPYFSLDLESGSIPKVLNDVYSGGKKLTSGGAVNAKGTIAMSGASKGTFQTAKGATDSNGKPYSLSGTWNCHGAFAKH
jgi:hypothetical protein